SHVDEILHRGWHVWERAVRSAGRQPGHERVETFVGGTASSFLRYIRFERDAAGEDQGPRHLLAERHYYTETGGSILIAREPNQPPLAEARLHELATEFQLSEDEILDVIASARRLRMAVRGWVAETHLERELRKLPGVAECKRLDDEGS